MRWSTIIFLNSCLLFATACDSNKKPLHPEFGNSVNQNKMVHIIKPRVTNPNAPVREMDGNRAFRAMDLYSKGQTEEPNVVSTTSAPASSGKK